MAAQQPQQQPQPPQQQQQDFHHIYIQHSDGQDTGPGYWPAPSNPDATKAVKKPTKDGAAEKTPRAKPQMIRLAEDDPRFIEWRIKLGILLKQEIAPNPQEGLPWYVEFPRGYWLYEKSKHLWVSGYPVKNKLFKSPQEFGLHLLWLISGSKDNGDCCCLYCNPPRVETPEDMTVGEKPPTPAQGAATTAPPPVKALKAATPKAAAPGAAASSQSATPSSNSTPTPTPTPPVAATAQAAPNSTQPQPTPAPTIPAEQPVVPFNANTSSLFFRTGELVWFQVSPSWRIGLIARSDYTTKQHDVLPISHGIFNQSQLQSRLETTLRPFLAFTVPPVSMPELADKSFDQIPWEAHIRAAMAEPARREGLLLDASKLAAVKISRSFSLFTHLSDSDQGQKANYHGAFLGAERVEVGDALRIRLSPDMSPGLDSTDAMFGLREIWTASQVPGAVFFKGDIFVPVTGDGPPPPPESIAVPTDKLPTALAEELGFRASVAPAAGWRLVLLRQDAVLREGDVRGRFYPSTRLLPVLMHPNLQQLQAELSSGVVRDGARQLNQRMDTLKDGYIGQKRNRIDMAGASVPHGIAAAFAYEPIVKEAGPEDERILGLD